MNQFDSLNRSIETLFEYIDHLYNNDNTFEFVKSIISMVESDLSSNNHLYSEENNKAREEKINKLLEKINTADNYIFDFIKYEYGSPLGLFAIVLDEDIPDIAMSNILIKSQLNAKEFENRNVPESVQEGFAYFMNHFVNNIKFIDEKKLSMSNAIMDSNFGPYRLNVVHDSLNSAKGPIITIRKHVQNSSSRSVFNNKKYENSINLSEEQIDLLKRYSGSSVCIFGEPGSGKTTMLRYLANHKLEDKRNLCVIEDTPELQLQTNISLVTNRSYSIKDLFTTALRQNPSHLIIGETRTDEIVDIMEAGLTFNVGTTIHANSLEKAIERIYFMSRPRGLNKSDIFDLVSASFDIFIHMEEREVVGIWTNSYKTSDTIYEKFESVPIENKEVEKSYPNNLNINGGLSSVRS